MQPPVFGRAFLVYVIWLVGSALWCTVTLVCVPPLLGSPWRLFIQAFIDHKTETKTESFTKVLLGGINCSVAIFVGLSVGGNITMWGPVQRKLLEGGVGSGSLNVSSTSIFSAWYGNPDHFSMASLCNPKDHQKDNYHGWRISLKEQCSIYSSSVVCVICISLEFSSVVSYKKKNPKRFFLMIMCQKLGTMNLRTINEKAGKETLIQWLI